MGAKMQIKANGIFLDYQELGPKGGVPLILVRGLGSTMAHWPPGFAGAFAALGYRVVMFDNRDIGCSQRCPAPGVDGKAETILAQIAAGQAPTPAYLLQDMAADVVGLMDALGLEKAHVFGMSMGGGIAQLLAIHHAHRLLSATLVMTRPGFAGQGKLDDLLSYPGTEDEYVKTSLYWDQIWGNPGFPVTQDYVVDMARAAYARGVEADGVNRQLLATINAGDLRAHLPDVALPCLVLHGAEDSLIPPEFGREIAALIPDAECHVIAGMGHTITPLVVPVLVGLMHEFYCRRVGAMGGAMR